MTAQTPTLLFQGDSITDADRDRDNGQPNFPAAMGHGYAYLAMCRCLAAQPGADYRVYNRGISGNQVPHLSERWQQDTIALAPTVLSILIGINDLWHKLDGAISSTPSDYERNYNELLVRTKQALPRTRLVVCEPFVLKTGVVDSRWFPEFEARRAVAERLAKKHQTVWVPFHQMFEAKVAQGSEPAYWANDGVHPTPQGHYVMAQAWCAAVGVGE
jgi:lysophospholipase L1-like esterase